ncbi:aminotransferase class V-fold PLP-dependent enzyme [Mycoplasmopsis felifaucium]|uniref:aminotransferase class V-fold PLP-dependent enzyme n=1 Tax=Mycoplasmopsis felifaucium TaxID=35768 RepID=UPI000480D6AD|nr:aminotransferase class V-fold PLP-dependent enzyme [Mycoplasmopsis felifaucium]
MNKIENVIIFAAGKGTRMAPLTQYLPKPLVQVNGEAMIERNIRFLRKAKIKNIYIVVGYLKDQFKYLEKKYQVKFITNDDYDKYNNISSLAYSLNKWGNTLYIEGDLYLKEDIIPSIVNIVENENQSITFGQECLEHKSEWVYETDDDANVLGHKLVKDAYSQSIWSGFLYINKETAEEMKSKFKTFYAIEANKEKYFEQFLWTLDKKLKHIQIFNSPISELDNFNDLLKIDSRYANHSTTLLFTPGPINNYQEVSEILSSAVLHHRSPLFKYYLDQTTNLIKDFFKTKNGLPLFVTCSATGAMEAIVVNLVEPGDKILLIEAGDFGKRFQIMIERLCQNNLNLDILSYPDGETYIIKDVEEKLKNNKYKSVFITHHETSTGVVHDVKAVGELIKKLSPESLYIVDTTSSFIHEEIEFDKWGIDAAIGTSGKAFCVMPGLSCVCLSKKAIEVARNNKNYKFYFDLPAYVDYYTNQRSTPYTPASSILIAINAAMKVMKNQTIQAIRNKRKRVYEYIRKELRKLHFTDVVDDVHMTHGLLVMEIPNGYDAEILRNIIDYKNNIYFELGRQERRKTQIRVGIPNVIDMDKAKLLVEAIKSNLPDSKIR